MKRCPQCSRNYYDDTLNFCLEDGASLVDTADSDVPPTAIFPHRATGESSEEETMHFDHATTDPSRHSGGGRADTGEFSRSKVYHLSSERHLHWS